MPASGGSSFPARIGNYRIEERLGAGGMGVVYRAFDEALKRPLAIKHLLPERSSATALRRFRREAQAAARLNHPAIVHIYDIVETPEGDWIVMELVEGAPLARALRGGPLDVARTVRLGKEIAEGLAEAHAHGIVHRDLKAANVMVTASGHAKILDFGIAKLLVQEDDAELSQAGIVLGTFHAMSPEQAQGLPVDHRSDLFSLGSLLYEMLTGSAPFRAASAAEMLTRICSFAPAPAVEVRPEVPPELSELVEDLLRKQPGERPGSARQVAGALDELERKLRPAAASASLEWGTESTWDRTLADGPAGLASRVPKSAASVPASPSATQHSSERRQMTVVCCELAGAGAGAVDPEVLHEQMAEVRALAAQVAGRHGGHPGGALGQRLLIHFGYPQVHEDSARRAVRAALELVERAGELRRPAGPADGLALRVGIHTGPAIVPLSPHSREPVTLGSTLDLAAELQALAAPGCVVASPATCALLGKDFAAEPLPPVRLAGMAVPVVPRRVIEARGAPEDVTVDLPPLLGREREMQTLLGCWELAREGRGQVVVVSGEAGIGKSRLALSLRQRMGDGTAGAVRWLSCFGSPYAQNSPLQPIVAPLRQALAPRPGRPALDQLESALAELGLAETLPLLATLLDLRLGPLGEQHPAPSLSPERLREKTLEALVALVMAMAERQPVVLLIEDLHWLDPTTLSWLDRLIEQAPAAPLLIVLTLRQGTLEAFWGPRAHLTQIALAPLAEAEAERLIQHVEAGRPLPAAIRRQIVVRADGIPLFVEELTRSVLESGVPGEERELPATLRDSLAARLDRLGAAKEIAQLASVIGRVFSLDLLAAVSLHDEATLQEELRQLIKAELVHRKGFGSQARYLFKHALVRDAAYDSLLKRERQALHRAIAEALRTRFPQTCESQPELLAQHYTEAGLAESAIDSWQRAGALAASRSASLEAISHFTQALRLLPGLPESPERDRRELEIQNLLAAATITGRGFLDPAVEQVYARAEALAERLAETEERFWAVLGLHTYHLALGNFDRALDLVERLLAIAEASGSPTLLSIGCFWLGTYRYYQADFAGALPELERAFDLAPPGDATYRLRTGVDLRVLALCFGALVLWHLGYPERARRRGAQAIGIAEELGHPYSLAFARGLGGAGIAHFLHDAETVRREAREVHDLATEMGFPLWDWQTTFLLVWARLYAPGPTPADDAPPEPPPLDLGAYDSTAAIEQLAGGAMDYYFCLHAEILLLEGRTGDALCAVEEALPRVAAKGPSAWHGELYRLKGEILRRGGGRPAELEPLFQRALALAHERGSRFLELRAALALGRLWKCQGREREAHGLVAAVAGGFTEGFDTRDLLEARAFLESCTIREAS